MSAPTVHPVVPLFRLISSQGDVLAHGSWSFVEHEALAAGVRGGRLDILGLPGTGKTLLLQNVEQKLRKLGQIPRLLRPGDTLDRIAETDVLLVDEGESFSKDELKRIRQHPNATVMTWLPSSFRAHQAAHVVLGPLSPEDVARYIVGRLTACQRTNNLFTPEALLALAHHSGGLFRLVIILASAALFFAEQRGAAQVVLEDVDEAAAMRALVDAPEEVPVKLAPLDMLQTATAHQRPDVHRRKLWLRPATRASGGIAVFSCGGLAVVAVAVVAALAVGAPLSRQLLLSPPLLASAAPPPEAAQTRAPDATSQPPLHVAVLPTPLPASVPPPTLTVPSLQQPVLAEVAAPVPQFSPVMSAPAERPPAVLVFAGPILNDTMGQDGQLSLQLQTDGAGRPVGAWFHASHGLIGSGRLSGEIGPNGQVTLSGQLMMGRNPFTCALQATLIEGHLIGEATFVRASSGARAHSRFNLIQS